jgi:hypothetical protein
MPVWGWILIALGVVLVLGVVAWQIAARRRTAHLRDRFGPEYNRVASSTESRRTAEAELSAREERREGFEIRPLSETARVGYVEEWRNVQSRFVDDPSGAVDAADSLLQKVMAERGYPVEHFDQRAADLSVDHPKVVENYREGHRIATASDGDGTATEDLRQAMHHYRALFEELVERVPEQRVA